MQEEVLHVLALRRIPGIGDVLAKQLISYCGSAAAVFAEAKGKLAKIPNIGDKTVKAILSQKVKSEAEEELLACEKQHIRVLPYFHVDYPDKLKLANDSPLLIYLQGNISLKDRKVVGIVGTRNATNYGKETTARIVRELIPHDAVIVSGLAYGIDIAAHRAALEFGLSTVGAIAGGLDMIYPSVHRSVAKEMLGSGAIISEQSMGIKPETHFFPARNRIIAGMSDTLIVVEAAEKGGALITANIAHSYDREVFAVPGDLTNQFSQGCNALIQAQKANIYTRIEDIEYLLNWEKGNKRATRPLFNMSEFGEAEQKLLRVLADFKDGLHLDELCWKSQTTVNRAASMLLSLEFEGAVKSLPGKKYQLVK